ncbi:uncharacterized protein LOC144350615 [Saccoglossus kowalevskii]
MGINSPGGPGGPTISPEEKDDVPQPGEPLGPGGPGDPLGLGGPGGARSPGRPCGPRGPDCLTLYYETLPPNAGEPGSLGEQVDLEDQMDQEALENLHYLLKRKKN